MLLRSGSCTCMLLKSINCSLIAYSDWLLVGQLNSFTEKTISTAKKNLDSSLHVGKHSNSNIPSPGQVSVCFFNDLDGRRLAWSLFHLAIENGRRKVHLLRRTTYLMSCTTGRHFFKPWISSTFVIRNILQKSIYLKYYGTNRC